MYRQYRIQVFSFQFQAGDGVVIPDDPVIGCECLDCIDGRKTCCGPMSGTQSAYTKAGRLKVPVGTPIYECNSRCKCGPECPNRVVQRGSKVVFS
jgi:histone-lysine N-methyltransferase SUV39H